MALGGNLNDDLVRIRDICQIDGLSTLCKRSRRQGFKSVFEAIDSVHGVEKLNSIKVFVSKNRAADGVFHRGDHIGQDSSIEISKYGSTPELTLTHEIGHLLECAAIPTTDPRNRQWFTDPLVQDWRQAVAESGPAKRLCEMTSVGNAEGQNLHGDGKNRPINLTFVSYLREDREFWARSYAQYIANRSRDERLLTQLETVRSPEAFYPLQWRDADFEPIAETLDILFKKIGWLR